MTANTLPSSAFPARSNYPTSAMMPTTASIFSASAMP